MSDCIEWTGAKNAAGYGHMKAPKSRKTMLAHRKAYQDKYGAIPEGMFVCHSCDNPSCINPEHLFLGTPKDNVRDMISKGRRVIGVSNGEANGRAKITTDIVEAIRSSGLSLRKIAEQYGISKSQAHRIVSCQQWSAA